VARTIGCEVATVVCNAMHEEDNARLAGDIFIILGGLRPGSEG
jgi:hypothetical protein